MDERTMSFDCILGRDFMEKAGLVLTSSGKSQGPDKLGDINVEDNFVNAIMSIDNDADESNDR